MKKKLKFVIYLTFNLISKKKFTIMEEHMLSLETITFITSQFTGNESLNWEGHFYIQK